MNPSSGNKGVNHLAQVLAGQSKKDHDRNSALVLDFGEIMDDFYIICSDKKKLQCILRDVRALMDSYGLELNQKTAIVPLRNGIDFLGFRCV